MPYVSGLPTKQLELARELVPGATRIGLLDDVTDAKAPPQRREIEASGQKLEINIIPAEVRTAADIGQAYEKFSTGGAEIVVVEQSGMLIYAKSVIAEVAAAKKLPTLYGYHQHVEAGGLISYGVDLDWCYRRAAYYVDKILKGANPADLPVEFPTTLITQGFYEGCELHVVAMVRGTSDWAQREIANLIGEDHISFLLDEQRFPGKRHRRRAIWQGFRRLVETTAPDVIISSSPRTDLITRVVALRHPRIKLATFEHIAKREVRFLHRLRARVTSLRCDIVLGDTPASLEATRKHYWGVRPRCSIPLTILEPSTARVPQTPYCFELLSIGRLDEQKNYLELIGAMALLKERKTFRLTIAGDGPQREDIMALAKKLEVDDRLQLAGFLPDQEELGRLRCRSHIYMQPSLVEGAGLAIAEAFAAGMVVLATDVGGVRDYGVDNRNMLKIGGFSAEAIAARLIFAMENYGQIAGAMSQAAIATARETFCKQVVTEHWKEARSYLMSPRSAG